MLKRSRRSQYNLGVVVATLTEIQVRIETLMGDTAELKMTSKENIHAIQELRENQVDNVAFMVAVKEKWEDDKKFRDRCWTSAVVILSPMIAICWKGITDFIGWLFHLFIKGVKT